MTRNRIRFELETTRPLDTSFLLDDATKEKAKLAYNRGVQFEVAIVRDGTVTTSASDFSSLTLVVRPVTSAGVIDVAEDSLLEKTVSSINAVLTQDQWDNDSGDTPYHAVFQFDDSDLVLDVLGTMGADNEVDLGIVFTGLTAAGRITLATGLLTFVNDGGLQTGGTPPTATRTMTDQEITAQLASKIGFTGNAAGSMIDLPAVGGGGIVIYASREADGTITLKTESYT